MNPDTPPEPTLEELIQEYVELVEMAKEIVKSWPNPPENQWADAISRRKETE